jgi:hypothetical protein
LQREKSEPSDRNFQQVYIWAYLPVGPVERQLREGIQGGVWEEVREDLQKGIETFLRWDIFGEASASYLLRCNPGEKVAFGAAAGAKKKVMFSS